MGDRQRQAYKKGTLSQDRTAKLEGIGFAWGKKKQESDVEQWEERFNELVSYNEEMGNCNVPQKQGKLGRWVKRQRLLYNKGTLPRNRTTQLEAIGFAWGNAEQREEG